MIGANTTNPAASRLSPTSLAVDVPGSTSARKPEAARIDVTSAPMPVMLVSQLSLKDHAGPATIGSVTQPNLFLPSASARESKNTSNTPTTTNPIVAAAPASHSSAPSRCRCNVNDA